MKTLAEFYCDRYSVPSEQFERHLLQRCLYPQARMFRNLLTTINPDFFQPDIALIRATGRLTRSAGFAAEVSEYQYDSDNAGRLRREWKLRLSVTRLRAFVIEALGEEPAYAESTSPFATQPAMGVGHAMARAQVR